jgi:DNA polymerase I-like protein with 3'-5' exonuclease and polymerase domains
MAYQPPLLTPDCDWVATPISELPSWKGARRVAIDTETCDPNLFTTGPSIRTGGYMVGYSFAIEDGPYHYVPMRHEGGDNLDEKAALGYLREQCKHFDGTVTGANLSYDLDWLSEEGIEFPAIKYFRDTQIAEPLLDEHRRSYSLNALAGDYLGAKKDDTLMWEACVAFGAKKKKEMGGMIWQLPGRYVGAYGEADVTLPLRILSLQERKIDNEGLWDIYNLESELLPVLVRMRRRGVPVDQDKLAQLDQWSADEEQLALNVIKDKTGLSIELGNIWASGPFEQALKAIGVKPPIGMDGHASINAQFLKGLDHPVADAMRRAREVNKIRTTFCKSIRQHMVKGRIHTTFNQLRKTKDDENPNMQQQPGKKNPELGKPWRSIFVAEEGADWACLDYSQQEPRMTVHFAEACKLKGAKEAGERYRNDPTTDCHQLMAELTKLPRENAKQIFLGLVYGMGGATLCQKLGLPTRWALFGRYGDQIIYTKDSSREALHEARSAHPNRRYAMVAGEEGQTMLNAFNAEVPWLSDLSKVCKTRAEKRGFITTLLGRKCRFPALQETGSMGGDKVHKTGYDWIHKALNRLIQGGSGDQTKKAMVECDRAGYTFSLQVHDELDDPGSNPKKAKAMAEIMENCVELLVPSKVDVGIGNSWGDTM